MKKCLAIFLLVMAAQPVTAAVYKWTDKDGRVHYGEQPPASEQAEKMHLKDSSSAVPLEAPEDEGKNAKGESSQDKAPEAKAKKE